MPGSESLYRTIVLWRTLSSELCGPGRPRCILAGRFPRNRAVDLRESPRAAFEPGTSPMSRTCAFYAIGMTVDRLLQRMFTNDQHNIVSVRPRPALSGNAPRQLCQAGSTGVRRIPVPCRSCHEGNRCESQPCASPALGCSRSPPRSSSSRRSRSMPAPPNPRRRSSSSRTQNSSVT